MAPFDELKKSRDSYLHFFSLIKEKKHIDKLFYTLILMKEQNNC